MQAMGFALKKPAFGLASSPGRNPSLCPCKPMASSDRYVKHGAGLDAGKRSRQSAVVRAIAAPARSSTGEELFMQYLLLGVLLQSVLHCLSGGSCGGMSRP
jgi:hypothetical protein